ncbi:MAG: FHA domain-containing protein [bacterium]|nr:FHA domain-containing protein [bacterium]
MTARIVYEIDGQEVSRDLDKNQITLGRDDSNDIVIELQSISRKHAQLSLRGERWRIRDLDSLNGTRVNELSHTDIDLNDGDTIYLYKFPVVFRDEERARVSLTPAGFSGEELGPQTIIQDAVDFSSLVARPPDVERFRKLLTLVTKASETIVTSTTVDETFSKVLDLTFDHLPVQRGLIMARENDRRDLVVKCVKERGKGDNPSEIRFPRSIADKVYEGKVAVLTRDAQSDQRFEGQSVIDLGIRSAMAAPLWSAERVEGLIYVDTLQMGAFDEFDLDLLSALGNHVAVALEQSRLQRSLMEQRLVRQRLARYHSAAVVDLITRSENFSGEVLMAEERDVTVLFADVVGFTHHCEGKQPIEIAELLNRYFSEMTEKIFAHDGTVDKFIGDCVMAVFGAPLPSEDHAVRAVAAALDMREALLHLNRQLPSDSRWEFRVGIHSGPVVAGDIGSVRRTDYTVLGGTVNIAARLEAAVAKAGEIVISEATRSALDSSFELRELGQQSLKGIRESVVCYEVLASGGGG